MKLEFYKARTCVMRHRTDHLSWQGRHIGHARLIERDLLEIGHELGKLEYILRTKVGKPSAVVINDDFQVRDRRTREATENLRQA